MNKIKFLSIFAVTMLIANIALLWFQYTHNPISHRHGPEGPKRIIIEKLGFDKSQIAAYEKLIHWHQNKVHSLDSQIMQLKNTLYANLNTNAPGVNDSIVYTISKAQMEIEFTHYKHFEDIKSICKPEQLPKFKDLTTQISRMFAPMPGKKPKH